MSTFKVIVVINISFIFLHTEESFLMWVFDCDVTHINVVIKVKWNQYFWHSDSMGMNFIAKWVK